MRLSIASIFVLPREFITLCNSFLDTCSSSSFSASFGSSSGTVNLLVLDGKNQSSTDYA
jgi:uncharacterized protein YccT (UPF0319 family)